MTLANDAGKSRLSWNLRGQSSNFIRLTALSQCPLHNIAHPHAIKWRLGYKIEDPFPRHLHSRLDCSEAGQNDKRDAWIQCFELQEELPPIHLRHNQIRNN